MINLQLRRKHKDFIILSIILFPVIFGIIKGCNYPVIDQLPKIIKQLFIKSSNDELWYNLSLGYAISYIFYILVNFWPDIKRELNAQRELLPLRSARYREIELLLHDIYGIWGEIFKFCIHNKIIKREDIKSISDLFNFDMIKIVLPYIHLNKPAIIYGSNPITWYEKLDLSLKQCKVDFNTYLTRYKDMQPSSLFFNIFYLLNSSFILGKLDILLPAACFVYGYSATLNNAIAADKLKDHIETTCKYIIQLINWYDNEYDFLVKNISDAETILNHYNLLKELDKE